MAKANCISQLSQDPVYYQVLTVLTATLWIIQGVQALCVWAPSWCLPSVTEELWGLLQHCVGPLLGRLSRFLQVIGDGMLWAG